MKVSDIMTSKLISVKPDQSILEASAMLKKYNIGALPVISEDRNLRGIVTDRDIVLRCVAADSDPSLTPVKEIMSRNIVSVSPDTPLGEAAEIMSEHRVRRLPVVEDGRVEGMISLGDMAKAHAPTVEISTALSEICSDD